MAGFSAVGGNGPAEGSVPAETELQALVYGLLPPRKVPESDARSVSTDLSCPATAADQDVVSVNRDRSLTAKPNRLTCCFACSRSIYFALPDSVAAVFIRERL